MILFHHTFAVPYYGNMDCTSTYYIIKFNQYLYIRTLWQYGLWSFQAGGKKLEIFLPKNQQGNY
jgi:hypothetical protein